MTAETHGIYRRQEGFRLAFKDPIPATFTLLKIQGKVVTSKKGSLKILDMSLKGAKVISPLQFPTPNTHISLELAIAEAELNITGELIWKKDRYKEFIYGLIFDPNSYSEQQLLEVLKKYVKENKS